MSTTELTTKTTGDVTISSQRRQTNPAALYLLTLSEGSSRDGMVRPTRLLFICLLSAKGAAETEWSRF